MFSSCCRCVSKKSNQQDDSDSEILKGNDDKSVGDNSKQEFLDENIIKFTGIGYDEGKKVRIPLHKEASPEKIDAFAASLDEKLSETIIDGEDDGDHESDDNALVNKSTDDIDKIATTTNTTASISSIENGKPVDEKLSTNDKNTASDTTTSSISCNTVVEDETKIINQSAADIFDNDENDHDNDEPDFQDHDHDNDDHDQNETKNGDTNNEQTTDVPEEYDDDNGFNPQIVNSIINKRASIQSDESSKMYPESCMSRRCSSKSSIKKRVIYNDNPEVIPSPDYGNCDDDEVFSDSIEAQLPRGDMCTPYLLKRGSLPGMLALPEWFSDRLEEGGILEPPTTPIGRDELALRRHRFFSDLLIAAQAAVEHRVRFDPTGPEEIEDCDPNFKPSTSVELEGLIVRLEHIVDRLERAVSAHELEVATKVLDTAKSLREITGASIKKSEESKSTVDTTTTTDSDQIDFPTVLEENSSTGNTYENLADLPTTLDVVSRPHKKQHNLKLKIDNNTNSININNSYNEEDIDNIIPTVVSQILPQSPPPPETTDICSDPIQASTEGLTMSVNAYQDIVNGPLAKFFDLSAKIGGDVATQADFVKKAFAAQLNYVKLASESSAPAQADVPKLLQPTSDQINNIQTFREKNRTSPFFNHLSAVSESIPALGWVCVSPTPGPHVKEMNDAGQFYTNRVLKDWKDKDSKHVEWARSWVQTLTELQQYIKQYHTTGLVWSKGKPAAKASAGGAPPPPPPGGMPPPPPVMHFDDLNLNDGEERNALFAEINKGADITKCLKKVTSDMQTHKNPSIRAGPAPYKPPPPSTPKPTASVAAPVAENKTPVFSRDGKKWMIEYQKNNNQLLVDNVEMNNVIYMFKCQNSTLTVKGKLNSIVIDSCKKCSVVFDSLVSSVEFVNCQSVQMQVLGKVPTISVDKTDGCQMYLSNDSLEVEIISSKSSEMNVMIPKGDGDFTEQPIPEQFKTTVKNNNLSTTFIESLG